jgi:hypothetical protein
LACAMAVRLSPAAGVDVLPRFSPENGKPVPGLAPKVLALRPDPAQPVAAPLAATPVLFAPRLFVDALPVPTAPGALHGILVVEPSVLLLAVEPSVLLFVVEPSVLDVPTPVPAAMKRVIAMVCCLTALGAMPAAAHHSLAAYIMSSYRTVDGTVKKFEWTNPHAKLTVVVTDASGSKEWNFEGGSIGRLVSGGFIREAIAPGDRITVAYNPRRDRAIGGFFIAATTSAGMIYSID